MVHHFISLLAITLFSLIGTTSFAQSSEVIRTGRPGQSIGPNTVGKGFFQIQTGINRFILNLGSLESKTWSNQSIVRFGISEHIELSALSGYTDQNVRNKETSFNENGFDPIQIGGRINVLDQKSERLKLGIQSRVIIYDGESFAAEGFVTILVGSFQINEKNGLTANFISNVKTNQANNWGYTLSLNHTLSEKFGCFIELYGPLDPFFIKVDGGFSFVATNNLQFDISAGWESGVSSLQNSFFGDLGVSWRFTTKRNS